MTTECAHGAAAGSAALAVTVILAACGAPAPPQAVTTSASSAAPTSTGPRKITQPYSPTIDPSAFSTTIDNPYFPLSPGTRAIYEAVTAQGVQRTITEVTRNGFAATRCQVTLRAG